MSITVTVTVGYGTEAESDTVSERVTERVNALPAEWQALIADNYDTLTDTESQDAYDLLDGIVDEEIARLRVAEAEDMLYEYARTVDVT